MLATNIAVDTHHLSDDIPTDEGEAEDEAVHILRSESADKLKAERQSLAKQQQDYALFRLQEQDAATSNPMDDFAQARIRVIDSKLTYRATPSQRIKQHTTAVEQLTARLNNIENQLTLLSKEYNEDFHKLSGAKRSLDKARHASLKQLSGKQKIDQFAALGAAFCDDLTEGCAQQEANHFGSALRACVQKVTLLLQEKEAAELAAALASKPPTPIITPVQSPAPSESRVRKSAKPPILQKGTTFSSISTPLSITSKERSSAPEFGSLPPTPQSPTAGQSQAALAPTTYTKDQAIALANLLVQQVKAEAQAELESLQEQAKMQVAANIFTIEQKERERESTDQASLSAERGCLSTE